MREKTRLFYGLLTTSVDKQHGTYATKGLASIIPVTCAKWVATRNGTTAGRLSSVGSLGHLRLWFEATSVESGLI